VTGGNDMESVLVVCASCDARRSRLLITCQQAMFTPMKFGSSLSSDVDGRG
jgi:hypothetical protein